MKILFGFTVFVIVGFLIQIVTITYFYFSDSIGPNYPYSDPKFWYVQLLMIALFIGVCFISKGLWNTIKKGPFEKSSSLNLRIGRILLLVVGVISLVNDMSSATIPHDENAMALIVVDVMLMIVGVGTLFTADVLKSGFIIKEENDLTV
ncbi:DUF2975 domain-containing protein [Nonlabens antarcticus]|uniref:DUF2975 domain-containing protein n=1 Tax=Nonlabens antarcticus TaxID=392714 RepID=UPI00189198C2|nr:DUF2975 domain-containing protein [Nonlabens antarcticus]